MKREECKEGMAVSFVRTREYGSGFKMTSTEGKVDSLGLETAVVRMKNGRKTMVDYEALSPAGQNRDLRGLVKDAELAAPDGSEAKVAAANIGSTLDSLLAQDGTLEDAERAAVECVKDLIADPRCAHRSCGYRQSLHFGEPPTYCKLRGDGKVDVAQSFKAPASSATD